MYTMYTMYSLLSIVCNIYNVDNVYKVYKVYMCTTYRLYIYIYRPRAPQRRQWPSRCGRPFPGPSAGGPKARNSPHPPIPLYSFLKPIPPSPQA